MTAFSTVPFTTLSLFVRPISESLGVEIGSVSLIYSIAAISSFATAMLIGKLLKKVDTRIIIICGGIFNFIFMFTVSISSSLIPMYITVLLRGIGGFVAGTAMAQIVISQWFDKMRATMFSFVTIFSSLTNAVVAPLLGTLMNQYGYRQVVLWEGVISGGVVVLIGMLLISGPPAKYGLKPYGYVEKEPAAGGVQATQRASLSVGQIAKFPVFWCLIGCMILATMGSMAYNSQSANLFQSMGLDPVQASFMLSVHAIATMVWSFLFGQISDRASPTAALVLCGLTTSAGFTLTFMWSGWTGAIIAAICYAARGPVTAIFGASMMGKLFGTKEAGSLVGFVHAGSSLGSMIGPAVAGMLFDSTGSYALSFAIVGVGYLVVVLVGIWAGSKKTIAKIKARQEALLAQAGVMA